MKKYRPSNGTEGICFFNKFCDNCMHESPKEDDSQTVYIAKEDIPKLIQLLQKYNLKQSRKTK